MRTETKRYQEFHYTTIVHFKDGTSKVIESKMEFEDGYKTFKERVNDWDRQGKQMREASMTRSTCTPVRGYDYFIKTEQEEKNKIAPVLRKEHIPLEAIVAMARE